MKEMGEEGIQIKPTASIGSRLAHFYGKNEAFLIGFCSVMFFLLAWEATVRLGLVDPLFLAVLLFRGSVKTRTVTSPAMSEGFQR